MSPRFPGFRLGAVLTTSFTGTLTERLGEPVERIPIPRRLADWLGVNGLVVGSCTDTDLEHARELRESLHAAVTAAAVGAPLPMAAIRIINEYSARGQSSAILTSDGDREWELRPAAQVDDALGVIAADAIAILAGERDGKLALCASPTCRAAFFDTSQSRTRRWCDMNTCGNGREQSSRPVDDRFQSCAMSSTS